MLVYSIGAVVRLRRSMMKSGAIPRSTMPRRATAISISTRVEAGFPPRGGAQCHSVPRNWVGRRIGLEDLDLPVPRNLDRQIVRSHPRRRGRGS